MRKKCKIHFYSSQSITFACGLIYWLGTAARNKRKVTCKRCRKTKIYKSRTSYGK